MAGILPRVVYDIFKNIICINSGNTEKYFTEIGSEGPNKLLSMKWVRAEQGNRISLSLAGIADSPQKKGTTWKWTKVY